MHDVLSRTPVREPRRTKHGRQGSDIDRRCVRQCQGRCLGGRCRCAVCPDLRLGKWSGGVASAAQIIWLRYVGGFLCVVAWALLSRERVRGLATPQLPVHAVRAAAGGSGGMAAIYAATNMPVADATAIGLLDGFFTVLLGVFVLKEAFTLRQWGAALVFLPVR
ncbi:MAG: DMT family transporter [Alphaproteobacteria bacterium]|nr:DMT family transporter [Alphaproteobacteria bacterium]